MHSDNLESAHTIRGIGGEIWAEMSARFSNEEVHWQTKNEIVDLIMGVLARHIGEEILDHEELPVKPLEKTKLQFKGI